MMTLKKKEREREREHINFKNFKICFPKKMLITLYFFSLAKLNFGPLNKILVPFNKKKMLKKKFIELKFE